MADREKTLKGLDALHKAMMQNQCYACSYEFVDVVEEFGTDIIKDALELLKEQEPQVLTLKEAREIPCDTPLCIEEVYGSMYMDIYNGIDMESGDFITGSLTNCPVYWTPEEYGRIYRFWTTKPTVEQRKGVKWDGAN